MRWRREIVASGACSASPQNVMLATRGWLGVGEKSSVQKTDPAVLALRMPQMLMLSAPTDANGALPSAASHTSRLSHSIIGPCAPPLE